RPLGPDAAVSRRRRRWRGPTRVGVGCHRDRLHRRRRRLAARCAARAGQQQYQRHGQRQPGAKGSGPWRTGSNVHAGPFGPRPALPCGGKDDNCCRGGTGGVGPVSVEIRRKRYGRRSGMTAALWLLTMGGGIIVLSIVLPAFVGGAWSPTSMAR